MNIKNGIYYLSKFKTLFMNKNLTCQCFIITKDKYSENLMRQKCYVCMYIYLSLFYKLSCCNIPFYLILFIYYFLFLFNSIYFFKLHFYYFIFIKEKLRIYIIESLKTSRDVIPGKV